MPKRVNYRKLAFTQYDPLCAHCGFGVPSVLEVAHLDGNRSNNELVNLVFRNLTILQKPIWRIFPKFAYLGT